MASTSEVREAVFDYSGVDGTHVEGLDVVDSRSYLVAKRITDIIVALFLLILFLPIIPVVVLLIKLDSPGPILFKQKRVGKNGKIFVNHFLVIALHCINVSKLKMK